MSGKPGRPRKQFCPKGHDTFVVGRGSSGRCSTCERATWRGPQRAARRRRSVEQPTSPNRYLPTAPLLGQLALFDLTAHLDTGYVSSGRKLLALRYAKRYGMTEAAAARAIERLYAATVVTDRIADRFATLIGVHPVQLWGWDGWFGVPDGEPIEEAA